MSNEYKDWLWDKFADVLLDEGIIDKHLRTIMVNGTSWYAEVDGIKQGCHVKYDVWFDDREGWKYKRSDRSC